MSPDPLAPMMNRYSCRAYKRDPIPDADLARMLEAMRRAPSAGNMQPWRFIVVRGQEDRDGLSAAALDQTFLSQAPVVIVVCADAERSASRYGERGRSLYVLQDTAAAVMNLIFAATALGYGTCWVGAFDEGRVSAALEIPAELRPVAMIPIGLPGETHPPTSRRPLGDIVEWR